MGRSPWTSRLTVEECPVQMKATALRSVHLCRGNSGTMSWPSNSGGVDHGSIRYEVSSDEEGRLAIIVPSQPLKFNRSVRLGQGQTIRLVSTHPHLGGERLWFVCGCGRRAGRLYLPTGRAVFRCRLCFNLTYRSSQEHNKRRDEVRKIFRQVFGSF
jgi:hypothetical protein